MTIDDGWAQALIGSLATAIGAVVAGIVWIAGLGSRVTSLEARVQEVENTFLQEQREIVAEIKEARDAVVAVGHQLSSSREEALRYFAGNEDLRRLEDKLDALRGAISHTPQTSRRRP
jgi:hypothetical protein